VGISAHEVRAIATSWAAFNAASVKDFLRAAYWNNETTSASSYLRDMLGFSEQIHRLGPFQWPEPQLAIDFWNCANCFPQHFSGFAKSLRVFI